MMVDEYFPGLLSEEQKRRYDDAGKPYPWHYFYDGSSMNLGTGEVRASEDEARGYTHESGYEGAAEVFSDGGVGYSPVPSETRIVEDESGRMTVTAGSEGDPTYMLAKKVADLQRQISALGGTGGVSGKRSYDLILPRQNQLQTLIKKKAQAYLQMLGNQPDKPTRYIMAGSLRQYLESEGFTEELAAEASVSKFEVNYQVKMMLAAGASGLVMLLTGGNFPVAAAAYFGVQAMLVGGGDKKELFAGVEGQGGEWNGEQVSPLNVELPEGIPNEIFAEYRFVCYDRLSGRWYPSDEVRPQAYDSREEFRWFCLDRVSGKVYKANMIKKPRIYLQ